jgi:anti-sigma-K factor RskA
MTKSTPNSGEKDNITAAEYALGVLQGPARDSFAKRIANEPALAAIVRQWDEHFADFAGEIASEQPPQHIEKALENRLFPADSKPSLWNSLGLWREMPTGKAMVAQVAGEGTVKLAAYYNPANGELRLNRVEGAAVSGRSLELWIIAGQDAPVSLGVLADATNSRVTVPAALREKFTKGILAVSDEPLGGSTTGAPTGAVLATGALTQV